MSEIKDGGAVLNETRKWRIRISGYGTYTFEGTETEAEVERKRKAAWEGGMSAKWPAHPETPVEKMQEVREWFFETQGSCPMWVVRKIGQLKKEATKP